MTNKGARILLVDDEPVVCSTLEMALETVDLSVDIASSAEEGLASLRTASYDLLIVDKNLGEMSGVDLLREIQGEFPEMSVMMITGYASVDSAMETLHLGISGYLEKPFDDIFEVVDRIVETLGQAQQRSEKSSHFARAMALLKSADSSQPAATNHSALHLLIAGQPEDEQDWLRTNLLGSQDSSVCVSTASELLYELGAHSYDIAVVDMAALSPEPLTLLKKLAANAPDTIVIATAEKPSLITIMDLIDAQVKAVLEKPFVAHVVEGKLSNVIQAARDAKHGANR